MNAMPTALCMAYACLASYTSRHTSSLSQKMTGTRENLLKIWLCSRRHAFRDKS